MANKEEADKKYPRYLVIGGVVLGLIAIFALLIFRLGNIMPGLSSGEHSFYSLKLGWHGIYNNPLNLPVYSLWSAVFKFLAPVSQFWLRFPAALTGGLTIIAFYILLLIWYGPRTAIFGSILFATSAWTLHVSRIADLNVEYLAAMTFFLLSTAILQKKLDGRYVYWLINLAWGLLLYVPGMVFFIGYNLFRQHKEVGFGMSKQTNFVSKILYVLSAVLWVPLIGRYLIRNPKNILNWLGLPRHFASPLHILKEFVAVFYHIFIHGPLLPSLWLDRLPILDIFSVITVLIGGYFYLKHLKATRTHLLAVSLAIGALLIALGGAVSLSVVMPIIYILVAAGLAYLLSQWLGIFPSNPIARSIGYILISLAVAISVIYNVRAYFVAWPHNNNSVSAFVYQPKR